MSKPYIFYVRGMTCGSCSGIIENVLRETYSTNLELFTSDITAQDPKKTTVILTETKNKDHQTVWEEIKKQIEDLGYNCEPYLYVPPVEQTPPPPGQVIEEQSRIQKLINWGIKVVTSHWFLGALGCGTGIALLIATLALGGLPLAVMIPLAVCSTLLTLALGARSFYEAWVKLVYARTLTMDTLFAISTLSVLVVSIASFFVPWLPMMFEVGLLIYGFRHIGIAIEDTIKEKINSAKFQDRAPKVVRRYTANGIEPTPLYLIQPQDIIIVKPGEIIPLDGVCTEETLVYNTIITGAILPRHLHSEDKVLAGMRVAENAHPLKIRVTNTLKKSYLARLDNNIDQSIVEKTPLEIKTQQILTYFIPTVIALAIISGVIIGFFFPAALAIQCAISVLVSACPCTLGLVIPLAVKTGIHKAAENGVQFKKSKIQQPEQIDTIVFDLNGTFTMGVPTVKHYTPLADTGISPDHLLQLCRTLEKDSGHRVGKSIFAYADQNCTLVKNTATVIDDAHHSGRSGKIDGVDYSIGSMTLMKEKGINTAQIEEVLDLEAGDSVVYIAREKTPIGYIIITDPLRKDAKQTVKALMDMGKEVLLCTGADEKTASRYAKALGITKIHAGCLGTALEDGDKSKPEFIKSLKMKGHKVAMVGDAANDAQALAASDFGIAVLSHDSDELTQKHAGAIIQNDTLLPIVSMFSISQQTVTNIKQNLLLSFGYNFLSVLLAGGLLLAIGIPFPPALGVVFMAIQACSVFYNVYRFKNQPLEHLQEENLASEETLKGEMSSPQTMNKHMPIHTIKLEDTPDKKSPDEENTAELTSSCFRSCSFWDSSHSQTETSITEPANELLMN